MTMLVPRKTPRQQRAQASVALMLDAAAAILEEQGWEALSTNAVAARAGISIGSLYQYFPGKEAMLAELIRREEAALLASVQAAAATMAGRPWMEGVGSLVSLLVDHQMERPRLKAALAYAKSVLTLPDDITLLEADACEAMAGVIDRFHLDDTQVAARDIAALAGATAASAARAGEERDSVRQRAMRAVWGYINTSPASIRSALR